jgi:hypothetical protein
LYSLHYALPIEWFGQPVNLNHVAALAALSFSV